MLGGERPLVAGTHPSPLQSLWLKPQELCFAALRQSLVDCPERSLALIMVILMS